MQDFKELKVWQKAHQLALDAYQMTSRFPREEMFGLTSQIRRAAVSIAANIAEGRGRGGDGDFKRFLQIAQGSAAELDYELLLARELHYITPEQHAGIQSQVEEVGRMLNRFIQTLAAPNSPGAQERSQRPMANG
jgi:four helix bundle protein